MDELPGQSAGTRSGAADGQWVSRVPLLAERDIKAYVRIVRKRWLLVAFVTIVFVALIVGLSAAQTPRYAATSAVLLQSDVNEALGNSSAGSAQREQIDTELEIMGSRSIREAVEEELGHPVDMSFAQKLDSQVITLTARSDSAKAAAADANAYANLFIETRKQSRVDELLTATSKLEERRSALRKDLEELRRPIEDLNNRIAVSNGLSTEALNALIQQRDALAENLSSQASSMEAQLVTFDDLISRLQASFNIGEGTGGQIISKATAPSGPFSPQPLRNGLVALVVGLVLGVIAAILREQFDDGIRQESDVQALSPAPLLGVIPVIPAKDQQILHVRDRPDSAAAEGYRALRVALQFRLLDRPTNLIQVTSSVSSEGKSTTVANLGVALAKAGATVLMVSADLRRPSIERMFGVEREPGLSNVLLRDVPIEAAVVPVAGEPRLYVLPCGPLPPDPTVLLDPRYTHWLFSTLASDFDYVIVDSPPLLPVSDAQLISDQVDGVLCVARAGKVHKRQLHRALARLEQVGARPVGTILTGVSVKELHYGYGYGYGSYRAPQARSEKRKRPGDAGDVDAVREELHETPSP